MDIKNRYTTLLLATTSYAGMGPYVASIVNSFDATDNVYFYLIEDNRRYYSNNIKKELLPKCRIVQSHMNKIKTLINLTVHPKSYFYSDLKKYSLQNNITTIHCLTSFHDVDFIKWFQKGGNFILTVHDLIQHESQKSFIKEFRQNVLFNRMKKCIEESFHLVTNSESQLRMIQDTYPQKKAIHFPFPTLITESIAKGNKICNEIRNEKDYILFFGRIEKYKGLSTLVEAYISSGVTEKLVIAGKGEFAGKINHPNIIYIDRYIDDEEIGSLYNNAKYVVYPYISATQSGVLSVASYFGKPMVLSDIPFFKDCIDTNGSSIFFEAGNSQSLTDAMQKINSSDLTDMSEESKRLYTEKYTESVFKNSLLNIYKS